MVMGRESLTVSPSKLFSHQFPAMLRICVNFSKQPVEHMEAMEEERPGRRLVYPMVFTLDGYYYSSTRFPLSVWIAENRRASSNGVPRGIFSVYIHLHGVVAIEWEFKMEEQHGVCLS